MFNDLLVLAWAIVKLVWDFARSFLAVVTGATPAPVARTTSFWARPPSTSNTPFELPPQYQLECGKLHMDDYDVLGEGGFTRVLRAVYEGDAVAVKWFQDELQGDKLQVYNSELETLLYVSRHGGHPNIVRFFGASPNCAGHAVIALELCAFGTLKDGLNVGTITRPLAMRVYLKVARAVAWLHQLTPHVVHRDLKANNILMFDRTEPRLADFGLAKIMTGAGFHARKPGRLSSSVDLSSPCGTRMWMAPELLDECDEYDVTIDSYAFGVTLIECLYPGSSVTTADVPKYVVPSRFGMVQRPVVPEWVARTPLGELIANCVAVEPEGRPRFPAIVSALEALQQRE